MSDAKPFSEADLYSIPSAPERKVTKEFETPLGPRTITIWADGATNSARFFKITEALNRAAQEVGPDALVFKPFMWSLPGPSIGKKGHEIVIETPGYLGQVYALAAVAFEPAWPAQLWAVFGDKMGPEIIEQVSDWAMNENGMTAYFGKQVEALKNALRAVTEGSALESGSQEPASKDSINSRKSPSRTSRKKAS